MQELADLVEFVAKALVDDPDAVEVKAVDDEHAIVIELSVAQEDLGKVIGREGRTARALRTLIAASGARHDKRAVLEILE